MEENQFKPGDIVYHKANNLRMVVTKAYKDQCDCKYVEKTGIFRDSLFLNIELYDVPTGINETPVVSQLEYRGIENKSK